MSLGHFSHVKASQEMQFPPLVSMTTNKKEHYAASEEELRFISASPPAEKLRHVFPRVCFHS